MATFIEHILAKQKPLALQRRQKSRLGISAGQAVVYDAGSIATPIILHLNGDGTLDSLQGCIDRWHMQARPHGLAEAYFVIMLQLVGYKYGAMATKDRSGVQILQKLQIRVFGRGLRVFRTTYTACSVMLHHGGTTDSHCSWSRALCPGAHVGEPMVEGQPGRYDGIPEMLSGMIGMHMSLFWLAAGSADIGVCSVH